MIGVTNEGGQLMEEDSRWRRQTDGGSHSKELLQPNLTSTKLIFEIKPIFTFKEWSHQPVSLLVLWFINSQSAFLDFFMP